MYKLYGSPRTRAFRVMWMLAELGLPYEHDPIRPRSEAARALNPSGKVPVLRDGDAAIIDSVAICQYLADKHGRFTAPAGTISRAQQDSFTQFAVDEVEGPLWTQAKHAFVLPAELRVEAVNEACRYDFDRAMAVLSKRLGDNPFVMGDAFTVPDIVLGDCCGSWAESIGWSLPEGNVTGYVARVRSRPAFKEAWAVRERAEAS